MRPSMLLTLLLSSTAIATRSLKWIFENNGLIQPWKGLTEPCFEMMEDLVHNNVVTLAIPREDAVKRFKSSPEFAGMSKDELCNVMKYHLIRGSYKRDELVEAGPFLHTLLSRPGANDSAIPQVLQVESGQELSFYSALRRKSKTSYEMHDYDVADEVLIHLIDTVLTPPLSMADTALAAGLTSAIGAANKINLDWWRDHDATYFMPTNEAFRQVGSVLNDASDDKLRNILTYHYLNDTETPVYTSKMNTANYTTAGGEDVVLSYSVENELLVNTARLTQANILVQNGVMHIIDTVSNPDNLESRMERSSPFSLPAFPNATASDKPPFADMITQSSKYHLEAGQEQARIPVGSLMEEW